MKQYSYGLILGRFQPLHRGHLELIQTALDVCDHLIIMIGSAQESGTERNPLGYLDRCDMIYTALGEDALKVSFIPLFDREKYSDDASFGEYIMQVLEYNDAPIPEVMFEGTEAVRKHWYETLRGINIVQLKRDLIPISATEFREALLADNSAILERFGVPGIEYFYAKTKERLYAKR
jgi:nicotinamide-nucleotide adenylyltransferase